MRLYKSQAGDTLVEVLLATVVISMVLAGAFTISNKALRINQTAQERTEVANKMREQAEIVRSLAISQNTQAWTDLITKTNGVNKRAYFNFLAVPADPNSAVTSPGSNYVEDYNDDGIDTYGPRGTVDVFDIWIERSDTDPIAGDYYTFLVKAEWDGIGDIGSQTSGLTIRVGDKN